MPTPPRPLSRYDLLQEYHYVPRLRPSNDIDATPPETATEERTRAAQVWQALQAGPEQTLSDRVELEKIDRALLASRKQVFAARADAESLRGELTQARQERFKNPMVYSLGALAAVSFAGWILQRRQLRALEGVPADPAPLPVLTSPTAFPPAVESTAVSQFDESGMDVLEDEAAQWIERAKVGVPSAR